MLQDSIFKANDIRGLVTGDQPQWDEAGARRLGAAFVTLTGAKEFVLGYDMRVLGEELSAAFIEGARRMGAGVIGLGLTSTDQLWYASGVTQLPGVQFTASHNPADYNGVKFCLAEAKPVPTDFMLRLRELANDIDPGNAPLGALKQWDCLPGYAQKLNELVPVLPGKRLKVVIDAGNGMAGHTASAVLGGRNLDLIGLYLELDGTFPNHPANPLEAKNLLDAQRAVRQSSADLGLVFDGDADRCFIIDETGAVVDPSVITAMIATAELSREPGGTIVINSITSQCVSDAVRGLGKLARSKVGHTYVKAMMAQHNGVFGGEHSAHYYFRDFWSADTGMLAALHILEQVRAKGKLSELASGYDGYARSGEINSTVTDVAAVQRNVSEAFANRGEQSMTDGLTITGSDGWWINLRASNTEPLLRLNVEARDEVTMRELRDEVLVLVRQGLAIED